MQCDEKWGFVGKKQKHCDPEKAADHRKGDCWDYVAFDPEHKLVLEVVVGRRCNSLALDLLRRVRAKLGGRVPGLFTTDGYGAYARAVGLTYGGPAPPGLCYAVVDKQEEGGRVVAVEARPVVGGGRRLAEALAASPVSTKVNTAFVERHHATDRHRNARKARKTYRFSKDWDVHGAVTYFTYYSYNFCWPVRTLRTEKDDGTHQRRTPAMAAGLAGEVWSLEQWLSHTVTGLPS